MHPRLLQADADFPLLHINNAQADAVISLHGGQVLTYQPKQQHPVLWLSNTAHLSLGKPIRGGVPVCWPWFGAHTEQAESPNHGFVRNTLWQLDSSEDFADGSTRVMLSLQQDAKTLAYWPERFKLQQTIHIGTALDIALHTTNLSQNSIQLTEALHSYLQISDVGQIKISGVDNTDYYDKVKDNHGTQQGDIHLNGMFDRVYKNTTSEVIIDDKGFKRRLRINKSGSQSTVIWNPWIDWSARTSDFDDDGYQQMVCVESANALDNRIELAPNSTHTLSTNIQVES